MIPKIIHYCWFGEEAIPVEQVAYIQDWKNRHSDWQFIFWNEKNAPMQVPYLKNAKELRKWANMSNYVRLHAVKEYGGIYLDTDIKLVQDLTPLLDDECFFGFEEFNEQENTFGINNAIFGARKEHDFITTCHNELLVTFDGSEEADLSSPRLITDLLIRFKGLSEYKEQLLSDIKLYPVEYFYPIHYSEAYKLNEFEKYIFPQTIAVHVWARTWFNKKKLIEAIDYLTHKTTEQEKYLLTLQHTIQEQNNYVSTLKHTIQEQDKYVSTLQHNIQEQDKYLSTLQQTIQEQESKASEIYFWKQHFENEFNNLKLHQEKDKRIIEYQKTYTELADVSNTIHQKVSDLLKWNNTLERLSEIIEIQSDLIVKRIEILDNKMQTISNEIDTKMEDQSLEFTTMLKNIQKNIDNITFIQIFTNAFKKKNIK